MSSIVNNYKLLDCSPKLCFIPEAGIGLADVNRISSPVPDDIRFIQNSLELELDELRNFTKRLNDSLNILTPWTIKVSHLRRDNKWVPVYSRFYDGLHLSADQSSKMARILKKFVKKVFDVSVSTNPLS